MTTKETYYIVYYTEPIYNARSQSRFNDFIEALDFYKKVKGEEIVKCTKETCIIKE